MSAQRAKAPKPATLKVWLTEKPAVSHDLANETDWAVIFEDVLEVKTTDGEAVYYPLTNVEKWIVKCA